MISGDGDAFQHPAGTFRWKAKADAYGDEVTTLTSLYRRRLTGALNAVIYQDAPFYRKHRQRDKHPTVNNAYRFLAVARQNKDGVFQMSEQLTEEEMALYDYQWGLPGGTKRTYRRAEVAP